MGFEVPVYPQCLSSVTIKGSNLAPYSQVLKAIHGQVAEYGTCTLRSVHLQGARTSSDVLLWGIKPFIQDPVIGANIQYCYLELHRRQSFTQASLFSLSECFALKSFSVKLWLHTSPTMMTPTDINYVLSLFESLLPSSKMLHTVSLILIKVRNFDIDSHRLRSEPIDWKRLEESLVKLNQIREFVFDYRLNGGGMAVDECCSVEENLSQLKARGILKIGE
ncbi:hypothetical protein C8Q75DRAFT_801448 [Abortiporus biennis]|nr:hypothetical protein C8Q75DRAFT_801448 [Abortiporus biennis]